jgi:putative acetyltransferase
MHRAIGFREIPPYVGQSFAGCAALRRLGDGIGEMSGPGRRLINQIIVEAKKSGYRLLRLDTLPSMHRAIALCRAIGFREIPPYGDNPAEAICFELAL